MPTIYQVEMRTVPLLMDEQMFRTITTLYQRRIGTGVSGESPYMFAYNKHSSLNCNAEHPEALRSTAFQKRVATVLQLLSYKDNELDMLAQFMCHDTRIHRQFYRIPEDTLQLAKLSKLFLLI